MWLQDNEACYKNIEVKVLWAEGVWTVLNVWQHLKMLEISMISITSILVGYFLAARLVLAQINAISNNKMQTNNKLFKKLKLLILHRSDFVKIGRFTYSKWQMCLVYCLVFGFQEPCLNKVFFFSCNWPCLTKVPCLNKEPCLNRATLFKPCYLG